MNDDYIKNYMRKRFGGSFWGILIVIAIIALLGLIDWFFQLGWF